MNDLMLLNRIDELEARNAELLAALEMCQDLVWRDWQTGGCRERYKKVKAVIAKAKPQQISGAFPTRLGTSKAEALK